MVERRDAVGGDQQQGVVDRVKVTHLTAPKQWDIAQVGF
jgi:hypothetical protein